MVTPIPPQSHPVILSQGHVSKAISDERFMALLPEFLSVKTRLQALQLDPNSRRGCSSCKKARAASTVYNDFVAIAGSLSPDGIQRLKSYFGVTQLMINDVDRVTGVASLRLL